MTSYRIIYFEDNRYGNTERYTIVQGNYKDALVMIEWLIQSGFAENVSDYFPIEAHYVNRMAKEPKLKPMYSEMSKRKFWR